MQAFYKSVLVYVLEGNTCMDPVAPASSQSQPAPQQPRQFQPSAADELEELEEPEEGDYAGLVSYNAKKLWIRYRDPIRRNFVKALAALVFIAVAYWYFFARPQPGALTIEIMQADSDKPVMATVSLSYEGGASAGDDILTDETGIALFLSVPSEKQLLVKVVPVNTKLAMATKTASVESGGRKSVQITVGLKTRLKFVETSYSTLLGPSCSRTLLVGVENGGASTEAAVLTADEPVSGFVKASSEESYLEPGDRLIIPVRVTAGGDGSEVSGSLRIKGTTVAVPLSIIQGQKPSKLDVSFDKADAKDFIASSGADVVKKSNVFVKNAAPEGSLPLTDVKVSVRYDFVPWVTFGLQQVDEANANDGVLPGGEVLFGYTVRIPAGTPPGEYIGTLDVSSSCGSVSLPLNAQLS